MRTIPQQRPIKGPRQFVDPNGNVDEGYTPDQVARMLVTNLDAGITSKLRHQAEVVLCELLETWLDRIAEMRRDLGDDAVTDMVAAALEARIRKACGKS